MMVRILHFWGPNLVSSANSCQYRLRESSASCKKEARVTRAPHARRGSGTARAAWLGLVAAGLGHGRECDTAEHCVARVYGWDVEQAGSHRALCGAPSLCLPWTATHDIL